MAFQINSNIAALNVYNNLGTQQAKAAASSAKISSGLKAAGGGDIASQGTAATLSGNAQVTQSNISQVQNAINALQSADTALGEVIALGQKGMDVGGLVNAAGADTSAITAQLTALAAGITSIGLTGFNGNTAADQLDALANVEVGGATAFVAKPTFATAPTVFAAAGTGGFTEYVGLAVDARAENAANLATLQGTLQVLNSVVANELAGVSQAQDTDIAKEMMNLTAANIMTEAATAMLAQAMQLPNAVLKLVQ